MKRILITGKNSYVGNAFAEWVAKEPDKYQVDKISVRDDSWKKMDFSAYDVILHVAGIAHQKETKENEHLYYEVNRDLAIDVAEKAKKSKVKQFIFLSTMSVYGLETGVINDETPLKPKTHYGKSKLQAEKAIQSISDESFRVSIIRPPMIYGKGCPGNYQRLRKFALTVPIFPNIINKRSMIFVTNLSIFIQEIIKQNLTGIYCPQNKEYVNTSQLVKLIARHHDKNIKLIKWFNPIINLMGLSIIDKVFGNLIYEKNMLGIDKRYNVSFIDFMETIKHTEE